MKVTTIGGAVRDIFIIPQGTTISSSTTIGNPSCTLTAPSEKVEVSEILEHTGGGATNSAVAFSRLGFDTSCICKVGKDSSSEKMIKNLEAEGVETGLILKSSTENTGTSYIIRDQKGSHIVFVYRGANTTLEDEELPLKKTVNSDFLYVTSLSKTSDKVFPKICSFAKQNKIPIALNPGMAQILTRTETFDAMLKNVQVLILNTGEAAEFKKTMDGKKKAAGLFSPLGFFRQIHDAGIKIAAITDGARGAYVSDGDSMFFHPSLPAKVVDTVGAGDSFGSAFAASVMMKLPIQEALKRALISSTSVIEKVGAKDGLLSLEELEKKAKETSLTFLEKTKI